MRQEASAAVDGVSCNQTQRRKLYAANARSSKGCPRERRHVHTAAAGRPSLLSFRKKTGQDRDRPSTRCMPLWDCPKEQLKKYNVLKWQSCKVGVSAHTLYSWPNNSGIGLSGKPKSHYSLWNVLPRGGAWNRAIWPIAEMLANALTANRGEC